MSLETMEKLFVQLVRVTIFDKLHNKKTINKEEFIKKFPDFEKKGATFVTITKNGDLRGCIGSLIPHTTLYEDLTSNALKAAFSDPRFEPLKEEEFEQIKIEISLIGQIKHLEYENFLELKEKIKPKIHGVILKQGIHQATFLPQVWEQLPSFETFIEHLYIKAGIDISDNSDYLEQLPQFYIYTVDKIVQR